MKTKETKRSKNKIVDWNDHLDKKYGKVGTVTRTELMHCCQSKIRSPQRFP